MTDEETLSWRVVEPGNPVFASDGTELGTVHRVLADDSADIFHGVSLRRGLLGPEVEIPADRVERITAGGVHTAVPPGDLDHLPPVRAS